MTGTIWENPTTLEVNADTTLEYQLFTSIAAQTLYTLTEFNYAVGTKSLLLFRDGAVLAPGIDFTELSSTTFSLGTPATGGEQIVAYGFVGITAEVPGPVSGTGIQVVDNFTAIRNYPVDDPDLLLYAKGKASDDDGFEGLFIMKSDQEVELPLDDDENALISAVNEGRAWIRLGAEATETLAGVFKLAAVGDLVTLTTTDKVIPVNLFTAAFNSILHGPLANGRSATLAADLDTLFYNINSVVIEGNTNSPLAAGQEGFLTVKMGDSAAKGVQTVVGNGSTTQGEVWRRFIVSGVWGTWVDITTYRTIPVLAPAFVASGLLTTSTTETVNINASLPAAHVGLVVSATIGVVIYLEYASVTEVSASVSLKGDVSTITHTSNRMAIVNSISSAARTHKLVLRGERLISIDSDGNFSVQVGATAGFLTTNDDLRLTMSSYTIRELSV